MEDWYVGNIYFRQQNQTNDYAEGAPEWDMQALLQNGVFPNPVTNRNRKSILDVLPPRRSNLANNNFVDRPWPMQLNVDHHLRLGTTPNIP